MGENDGSNSEEQLVAALGAQGPAAIKWLKDRTILGDFAQLVSRGCDPRELFAAVGTIQIAWHVEHPPGPVKPAEANTFEGQIGFNRSALNTVVKRMQECADDLARLNVRLIHDLLVEKYLLPYEEGGWFSGQDGVVQGPPVPSPPTLGDVLAQPEEILKADEVAQSLRFLAVATEHAADHVYPVKSYDEAVGTLVNYVHDKTGQYGDNEVSALAAATRGDTYDAEAHRKWRERHSASG